MRLPIRNVVMGALAGAAGTLAMDFVWYGRYRKGGGGQAFPELAVADIRFFGQIAE